MIKGVKAAERLDSRGNPTVQVDVTTSHGTFRALVPSGASTGEHEAVELRDKDDSRYGGKGVIQAVHNVEKVIGPALVSKGFDPRSQLKEIDAFMKELDGTSDKSCLGANAILGISMACARAGAAATGVPLYEFLRNEAGIKKPYVMPAPFLNILNGGVHSGNTMAFQEIMIAPTGASSFEEGIRMAAEVYHTLKWVIAEKFGAPATGVGDEGGFAPPISTLEEALDLLSVAIDKAGFNGRIKLACDPASSEFFNSDTGEYDLAFKNKSVKDVRGSREMRKLYKGILEKYPMVLLEDPFAEDDWKSWSEFNRDCPVELVGDDLLCTNIERVKMAAEKKACNAMLLKVNQIGTVSEAIEAANYATSLGWGVFVSHRSGETTDDFIADLTVGLRTGHLKSGAPARGERVAKYNRLLDIEAELRAKGEEVAYAGESFRFGGRLNT
ncbi:hypothetical protein FDECE_827 [Fusarium decemcellulare]|nr:hypothetical protein FDECE_827 [Fusarium decemcellulare]